MYYLYCSKVLQELSLSEYSNLVESIYGAERKILGRRIFIPEIDPTVTQVSYTNKKG